MIQQCCVNWDVSPQRSHFNTDMKGDARARKIAPMQHFANTQRTPSQHVELTRPLRQFAHFATEGAELGRDRDGNLMPFLNLASASAPRSSSQWGRRERLIFCRYTMDATRMTLCPFMQICRHYMYRVIHGKLIFSGLGYFSYRWTNPKSL